MFSWIQLGCGIAGVLLALRVVDMFVQRRRRISLNGKVCVVTGGSSGIGLAAAKDMARQGATVVLLARRQNVLEVAQRSIQDALPGARVSIKTVDVTDDASVAATFAEILKEELCKTFEDTSAAEFSRLMRVNVEGCANCARAVVGHMKRRRSGRISFVSSAAGQVGVFGYAGYSASKFGLRGFAEVLAMELRPFNVNVSMSFPPDTNTPMLEKDDETKPIETAEISGTMQLLEPEVVAKRLVDGIRNGEFFINFDFLGDLLGYLTSGFAPLPGILNNMLCLALLPIGRIIAMVLSWQWDGICKKYAHQKKKTQ